MRQRLQQIGICRASGHSQVNGCRTMPLYDGAAELVNLYGLRTARTFAPVTERHARLRTETASGCDVGTSPL